MQSGQRYDVNFDKLITNPARRANPGARRYLWRNLPRWLSRSYVHGRRAAGSIRTIKKNKMLRILRKRIRRPTPWWPICCPASRSTGIIYRSY
jgi:hypothetical protein